MSKLKQNCLLFGGICVQQLHGTFLLHSTVSMQNSQRRIGSVNDIDPVNGYYSSAAQEQQFLLQQKQYLEHQRHQQLAQQEEFKRQQLQSQPQYNNHQQQQQQQQSQPKSMSKVVSQEGRFKIEQRF